MSNKVWTLTEIAKLLLQPQHRLIYLCEKGVIVPDVTDAKGRGSSRRFSARNIFEFSIALTLGEFQFPTEMSGKILLALRSFEKILKKTNQNFGLPHVLTEEHEPEIRVLLTKGSCLHFAIGDGIKTKLIGGVNLLYHQSNEDWPTIRNASVESDNFCSEIVWRPAGSEHAYFELNLTKIAKDLQI